MAKNTELQRFVDEIEAIEEELKERNEQKSAVYKAAKGKNINPKALRTVIGIRRARRNGKAEAIEEHNRQVDEYMEQLD